MIVFDIDGTLSPTHEDISSLIPGEIAEVFGFPMFIPSHLLDFIKSRKDIALLSTWGAHAAAFAESFKFQADVLLITDYSDEINIEGKFELIKELKPAGWADDHILPFMELPCKLFGTMIIVPKTGFVTKEELEEFLLKLR